MEHKEKQTLVTLINSILIPVIYSLYVYYNYVAVDMTLLNDFKFWGKAFIFLIIISIVAQIIIHILFVIINKIVTNEELSSLNDERDKLIDLKSIRISHWVFTIGFMITMSSLAIGMAPYVMFLGLVLSGFFSGIISEASKLYFYRKGF